MIIIFIILFQLLQAEGQSWGSWKRRWLQFHQQLPYYHILMSIPNHHFRVLNYTYQPKDYDIKYFFLPITSEYSF